MTSPLGFSIEGIINPQQYVMVFACLRSVTYCSSFQRHPQPLPQINPRRGWEGGQYVISLVHALLLPPPYHPPEWFHQPDPSPPQIGLQCAISVAHTLLPRRSAVGAHPAGLRERGPAPLKPPLAGRALGGRSRLAEPTASAALPLVCRLGQRRVSLRQLNPRNQGPLMPPTMRTRPLRLLHRLQRRLEAGTAQLPLPTTGRSSYCGVKKTGGSRWSSGFGPFPIPATVAMISACFALIWASTAFSPGSACSGGQSPSTLTGLSPRLSPLSRHPFVQ